MTSQQKATNAPSKLKRAEGRIEPVRQTSSVQNLQNPNAETSICNVTLTCNKGQNSNKVLKFGIRFLARPNTLRSATPCSKCNSAIDISESTPGGH